MLAAGTSQAIGKRLSRRLNGTSVAPGFMPKRNSELSDSRGRRTHDAVRLEIGDEQVCGDEAHETRIRARAGLERLPLNDCQPQRDWSQGPQSPLEADRQFG